MRIFIDRRISRNTNMVIPPPWSGFHAGPGACRDPACFQPERAGTSWFYSRSPSRYEPGGDEKERKSTTTAHPLALINSSDRLCACVCVNRLTILANSSPSSSQATPPGL